MARQRIHETEAARSRAYRERMQQQGLRPSREKMLALFEKGQELADLAGDLYMWEQGIQEKNPVDLLLELLDHQICRLRQQQQQHVKELEDSGLLE